MFLLLAADPALAYGEEVHVRVTRGALAGRLEADPAAPDPAAFERLRARVDRVGRADLEVGPEWARRYPQPVDRWALKELLLLNPDKEVWGFDRFDLDAPSELELLAQASRQPDDDHRNRERLAHDADRKPRAGVPADPALLNMGRLGALSSQAHAHYGLKQLQFSEDSEVLKADPPRFAVAAGYPKGPVLTLAAEMAQANLDLALLAAIEGDRPLSLLYTGAAFHYLEDVANPIHCVQVGLYDFFVDAFKERLWMSARTGGGYLGQLRSLASIGIDILSNHHTLSEELTEKRLIAGDTALTAALAEQAPGLDARLDPAGEFGMLLTRAMIDASAGDGAPMYAATRAIASPRLRRAGEHFDDEKDDPFQNALPEDGALQAEWGRFWALQAASFSRAGTGLRAWMEVFDRALPEDPAAREAFADQVATRLVRRQLTMLQAAEARRADFEANPPDSAVKPERMPGMLAGELAIGAVIAVVIGLRLRRRR